MPAPPSSQWLKRANHHSGHVTDGTYKLNILRYTASTRIPLGAHDGEQAEVAMQADWKWDSDTTPFSTLSGQQPASFALQEIGDNDFKLLEPFGYTSRNGKPMIPVTPHYLPGTDLASIPSFLGWFARRHGRHTPAALLHDELVTDDLESLPEPARMERANADLLFREALVDSGVPLVKSWVLWTGVTLPTRWRSSAGAKIALATWFAAALAGTGLLVYGLWTTSPIPVAIALVAPALFAFLWGRAWPAGLIAGYSFWVVVFGSLPGWLAYQIYRGAEYVALDLRRLRPQNKGIPLPPPEPYTKR